MNTMVITGIGIGMAVMTVILLTGIKYDETLLNLGWLIIGIKMADVSMVLIAKGFEQRNEKEKHNIEKEKQDETHN